jgi:hypothetical protein
MNIIKYKCVQRKKKFIFNIYTEKKNVYIQNMYREKKMFIYKIYRYKEKKMYIQNMCREKMFIYKIKLISNNKCAQLRLQLHFKPVGDGVITFIEAAALSVL